MHDMGKEPTAPVLAEKLKCLIDHRGTKPTAVADAAGVTRQAMYRYLDGAAPRHDAFIGIARFFEVDPVWLADETEPWADPPPRPGATLEDAQLMSEVFRRYRNAAKGVAEILAEAERIDWGYIGEGIADHKVGAGAFDDIDSGADVASALPFLVNSLDRFDTTTLHGRHDAISRGSLPVDRDSLRKVHLVRRVEAIHDRIAEGMPGGREAFNLWQLGRVGRGFVPVSEAEQDQVRELLSRYREAGGRYSAD